MTQRAVKRVIAGLCLVGLVIFLFGHRSTYSATREKRSFDAPLVMVLATNLKTEPHLQKILANRQEYATRHGYRFITKYLNPIDTKAANGWARLHAMREVIEEHPDSEWFWLLDQDAIIMDPEISITKDLLYKDKLDALMLRDVPIVPPDSVIRTLKSTSSENVQLVISHDHAGINTHSFFLHNGDFGRFFLETWTQPLYQSYGFERQETSALEHIIQWHYTILSKAALVSKRVLASYAGAADDMAYKEGDFVVMFDGCSNEGRSCVREFERYWTTRGRTAEGIALEEKAKLITMEDKDKRS